MASTPFFPSKRAGLSELLGKVLQYPQETQFYFRAWTFGYEEVWIALAAALDTRIHFDGYWRSVYDGLRGSNDYEHAGHEDANVDMDGDAYPDSSKKARLSSNWSKRKRKNSTVEHVGSGNAYYDHCAAALVGFREGNRFHEGCLTGNGGYEIGGAGRRTSARVHSCQRLAPATGSAVSSAVKMTHMPKSSVAGTVSDSRAVSGICPIAAAVSGPELDSRKNLNAANGRREGFESTRVVEIIPVVKRAANGDGGDSGADIYEVGAGGINDDDYGHDVVDDDDDDGSDLKSLPSQIVSQKLSLSLLLVVQMIHKKIITFSQKNNIMHL